VSDLPPSDTDVSLLDLPKGADVLIDRIQFGVDILTPVPASGGERFCSRLYSLGIIPKVPRLGSWQTESLSVSFDVLDLPGGGSMTIGGEIILRPDHAGRIRITNRSQLRPDLLRALRSQLADPGDPATGGATNLVGPHGPEWGQLFDRELRNLSHGLDRLMSVLAEAADIPPEQLLGRLWVQQCEIYRDLPEQFGAAEELVHDLANRPLMGGATQTVQPFQEYNGDRLAVRWDQGTASAPIRKVYAKRPDLLRTEIQLANREAVRALLETAPAGAAVEDSLSGAAAAFTVGILAKAAVPLLDDMLEAVRELYDVFPRGGTEFLLGLTPLLRLIAPGLRPKGTVGRPPSDETARQARRALQTLILSGRCEMPTRGTSEKLRETLIQMEQDGLLRRVNNRPSLFAVRPEFEDVRQALRLIRRRDDRIDEHLET
jgi:hypothetical protein